MTLENSGDIEGKGKDALDASEVLCLGIHTSRDILEETALAVNTDSKKGAHDNSWEIEHPGHWNSIGIPFQVFKYIQDPHTSTGLSHAASELEDGSSKTKITGNENASGTS